MIFGVPLIRERDNYNNDKVCVQRPGAHYVGTLCNFSSVAPTVGSVNQRLTVFN
jgi:hypothetical protein